jgi:hypothetical protein
MVSGTRAHVLPTSEHTAGAAACTATSTPSVAAAKWHKHRGMTVASPHTPRNACCCRASIFGSVIQPVSQYRCLLQRSF